MGRIHGLCELLLNWIKPSRAFVVVAGTADHPDWVLGKMNSPLAASNLNHTLKQCEFALNRVALADLQAFITVAGKIGGGKGSDDACRQRVALERFQAFDFRIGAFMLRSDLGNVRSMS